MDAVCGPSNNHTAFLRAEGEPVRNLMGYTAADKARPGYHYINPLKKAKTNSIFIPKHAQAKPMRGFGVPGPNGIVKNVSVRHPGAIGWVRRAPTAPPVVVAPPPPVAPPLLVAPVAAPAVAPPAAAASASK